MILEIKSIICTDEEFGSLGSTSNAGLRFYFQAEIGIRGEQGADIFGFYACNPQWFTENFSEFLSLKGYFLVSDFSIGSIETGISEFLKKIDQDTWESASLSISRYMFWEFENYVSVDS